MVMDYGWICLFVWLECRYVCCVCVCSCLSEIWFRIVCYKWHLWWFSMYVSVRFRVCLSVSRRVCICVCAFQLQTIYKNMATSVKSPVECEATAWARGVNLHWPRGERFDYEAILNHLFFIYKYKHSDLNNVFPLNLLVNGCYKLAERLLVERLPSSKPMSKHYRFCTALWLQIP